MPRRGLEPPRDILPLAPKASVSASFTISAVTCILLKKAILYKDLAFLSSIKNFSKYFHISIFSILCIFKNLLLSKRF